MRNVYIHCVPAVTHTHMSVAELIAQTASVCAVITRSAVCGFVRDERRLRLLSLCVHRKQLAFFMYLRACVL